MIKETLNIPRFTALRGEKREWVQLYCPDLPKPVVLVQGTNLFGLEDIRLTARDYLDGIVGSTGSEPEAGNVFLRRVRVRALRYLGHPKPEEVHQRFAEVAKHNDGGNTVSLGGRNVEITDCDFYGCGRGLVLTHVIGGSQSSSTASRSDTLRPRTRRPGPEVFT